MKSLFLPVLSRSISVLAVGTLLGATAFAQAPAVKPATATPAPAAPTAPAAPVKPLPAGDEAYVKNVVKGMSYLIQMAKVLPVSADPTQATANRLRDSTVKDLTAALANVNKIVEAHGLKIPTEMVGTDKADIDRVTKGFAKPPVKGFETKPLLDWVSELNKEAKRLDRETETIGKQGQDADVKTFASNYGPSIRVVFSTSETMEKALKAPKKK